MQDRAAASREVIRQAQTAGFDLCGIAPAQPSDRAAYFKAWLSSGKHGEMHYLANHLEKRLDVQQMMPGCQSIVVVARFYNKQDHERASLTDAQISSAGLKKNAVVGQVARYATDLPGTLAGSDYHKVIKKQLHQLADGLRDRWPEFESRACVDTAPVMEREHATRAGLGWIGKHTLLIHPKRGSWMLLGCLLTTMDLATTEQLGFPDNLVPRTDHCGTCTRCIDACPTQAITPYQVDASKCISYLTIEHRSMIDPALQPSMESWIGGCDVCQEVCPHNSPSRPRKISPDNPRPRKPRKVDDGFLLAQQASHSDGQTSSTRSSVSLKRELNFDAVLSILDWTEDDRRRVLQGNALKRIKLDMWKRNALIGLSNAKLTTGQLRQMLDKADQMRSDPEQPTMVRETARQVTERLEITPI